MDIIKNKSASFLAEATYGVDDFLNKQTIKHSGAWRNKLIELAAQKMFDNKDKITHLNICIKTAYDDLFNTMVKVSRYTLQKKYNRLEDIEDACNEIIPDFIKDFNIDKSNSKFPELNYFILKAEFKLLSNSRGLKNQKHIPIDAIPEVKEQEYFSNLIYENPELHLLGKNRISHNAYIHAYHFYLLAGKIKYMGTQALPDIKQLASEKKYMIALPKRANSSFLTHETTACLSVLRHLSGSVV